jgi:hypothetical protein
MTSHNSEGSSTSIEYAQKSIPVKLNASYCTEALSIVPSLFEKKRKALYKQPSDAASVIIHRGPGGGIA